VCEVLIVSENLQIYYKICDENVFRTDHVEISLYIHLHRSRERPNRNVLSITFLGGVTVLDPTLAPSSKQPTFVPTSRPPSLRPTLAPTVPTTFVPTTPPPSASPSPLYPPSRYTATPYYQYPSYYQYPYPSYYQYPYPSNYYYPNPSSFYDYPTSAPKDDGKSRKITLYIVLALVVITLIVLRCGRSEFDTTLEVEHVDRFYDNILNSKHFVVHYPPACFTKEGERGKPYALFFSTRIKILWVKHLAYLQFVLGWISFFPAIIGLIDSNNKSVSIVAAAALFLSELVVHLWYGFLRYPNLGWLCLGIDRTDDHFENLAIARKCCTRLFHGDRTEREHKMELWMKALGIISTIPLHVASVIGVIIAFVVLTFLACYCRDSDIGRNITLIGIISSVIGSLAYPILFVQGDTPLKVVASIGH
jgi:hypothetical protein